MENTGANQGKELNTTFKLNYKRTIIIGFAFLEFYYYGKYTIRGVLLF